MLNTNTFFNEGDNEGEIPFGVILSLVDTPLAIAIIKQRSENDFNNAYSPSNFQISESFGVVQLTIRIFNLGDVDSNMTYLWLIVLANDNTTKIVRIRQSISVKSKSHIDFLHPLTLVDIGVNDFNDVKNVYAIVSDPLFDKLEKKLTDFIDFIRNNDLNNAIKINPCRVSRKVGSWNLSQSPFQLNANTIIHDKGFADFILVSVDAGANANFGILNPDGSKQAIINDLKGQTQNIVLNTVSVNENEIVFYLDSDLGVTKYSNRASDCRLSSSSYGIIDLEWEDGGDGDYNDYRIRMIHR